MKKITALLFAGIIAMAFASVADAGTVLRTQSNVQNKVLAPAYTQNQYTYSTSTSSSNQSDSNSYSWFYQNHSHGTATAGVTNTNTAEGWLNQYQINMANSGWTLVSQGAVINTSSSSHKRTDVYTKTVTTTTTTFDHVEKTDANFSSSVSYKLEDGVLVAVRSSSVQDVLTNVYNVNTNTETITKTVTGSGEPITLDTTNTGKITTANHEWLMHAPTFYSEFASKFDFTGDGIADNCEWLSDNPDALLCMPVNGQINGVTELFGNLGGYANGFDKLSVLCDKDGNGIVEGNELEGLMLWVDSNRNGIADAGELKTLDSYGITKFYTDHKNFVGKYETSDGQTHTMWAWFPSLQQ